MAEYKAKLKTVEKWEKDLKVKGLVCKMYVMHETCPFYQTS